MLGLLSKGPRGSEVWTWGHERQVNSEGHVQTHSWPLALGATRPGTQEWL